MPSSHTAHGYWLEEAGPVAPRPALAEPVEADVVVVGGGYLGLWTAWNLLEHDPELHVVVLEADRCGHGPSGRNGGFATALWDDLPELRSGYGDAAALELARASSAAVAGLGQWCSDQGVDAWYRRRGHLQVAAAPAQEGAWSEAVAACAELGVAEEFVALDAAQVAARCGSPVFGGGALMRDGATVQPARLALGLRAKVIERGADVREHARVRAVRIRDGRAVAVCERGSVTAPAAVLALGGASAGQRPLRRRLTVASSHIVLSEPVPDVLADIGWTGGECIVDCRTFLHYFRTTPEGRVAFGWAGGRMGYGGRTGGRLEVDPAVVAQAGRDLVRVFPDMAGRRLTHAWGGPIDVSPTHLPVFGSLHDGRVHYGFGFTGNGVAPSWLGGRVLAGLALDRREPETRLALVEPGPVRVPPEPLRYAGGSLIRAAWLRRERLEDAGRSADPLTRFVTEIPRRLGVHIGR